MRGPVGAGGWPLLGFLAASMNLPRRFHSFVPFSGVLSRDERRGRRPVLAAATPAASPPLSRRPMLVLIVSLETRQMRGEKVRTSDPVGLPESCLPHPQTPSHTTTLELFPRKAPSVAPRAQSRGPGPAHCHNPWLCASKGPGEEAGMGPVSAPLVQTRGPILRARTHTPEITTRFPTPFSIVRKRPDAAHSVPRFPLPGPSLHLCFLSTRPFVTTPSSLAWR